MNTGVSNMLKRIIERLAPFSGKDVSADITHAGKWAFYFVLIGLIAGLGGFGITNFSGGGTSIASVGDREITAEDYYRAMVQAIRAQEASGATDMRKSFNGLAATIIQVYVSSPLQWGVFVPAGSDLTNEAELAGLELRGLVPREVSHDELVPALGKHCKMTAGRFVLCVELEFERGATIRGDQGSHLLALVG